MRLWILPRSPLFSDPGHLFLWAVSLVGSGDMLRPASYGLWLQCELRGSASLALGPVFDLGNGLCHDPVPKPFLMPCWVISMHTQLGAEPGTSYKAAQGFPCLCLTDFSPTLQHPEAPFPDALVLWPSGGSGSLHALPPVSCAWIHTGSSGHSCSCRYRHPGVQEERTETRHCSLSLFQSSPLPAH